MSRKRGLLEERAGHGQTLQADRLSAICPATRELERENLVAMIRPALTTGIAGGAERIGQDDAIADRHIVDSIANGLDYARALVAQHRW